MNNNKMIGADSTNYNEKNTWFVVCVQAKHKIRSIVLKKKNSLILL